MELVGPRWFISPLWSPEPWPPHLRYCSPTQLDRAIPMLSAPAGLCQRSLHGGDSRSVLPPSSSPWTGSALTPALGLLQPGGYNLKRRGGKSCAGLRGEAGDRRACSCSPLPPNSAHWSSTGLGPGNGTMYRQHQCFGGASGSVWGSSSLQTVGWVLWMAGICSSEVLSLLQLPLGVQETLAVSSE